MLTLPNRLGYTVEWETSIISKRTGKPLKKSYENINRKDVEAKRNEMLNKGCKVSEIMECIF